MGENSFGRGRLGETAVGLAVFVLLGLGVAAPASAEPESWAYPYTGEAETFVVPPEVHDYR
jgi:hypothetical protein